MDLTDLFKKYLGPNVILSPELLSKLATLTDKVDIQKGQKVIREGTYSPYSYLIIKGSARSYYLKDGKEIVNWFALEEEIVASMDNYNGEKSQETIVFMEDSHCLRFNLEEWKHFEKTKPIVSNLSIKLLQDYVTFLEKHARNLANSEGITRYHYLLKENPEYFLRIPSRHLASYLGMSRENLSRLRSKKKP